MEVWPAIDLRGGACVRLTQGDYDRQTTYSADPGRTAEQFVAAGAKFLHLVDLDAAKGDVGLNDAAIAQILAGVRKAGEGVTVELGGGVRTVERIEALFALGLDRLILGTRALLEPHWAIEMAYRFPRRIAIAIDARDGRVATHGWQAASDVSAHDLAARFEGEPIASIIYTDIATDGMLAGPNVAAMSSMKRHVKLPVIASGGVTTVADVDALHKAGLDGLIIGRALYEGRIALDEALRVAAAPRTGAFPSVTPVDGPDPAGG